ncbi:MAG: iron-containing alcohol dehydrogenase [Candidatus Lokiarchaeota archaeon]|nr:iron-containing alcohol dehydrogenase [Candidatus Lokiarchaeota archaeon]
MDGEFKPFTFRSPRIVFKRNAWKDLPRICGEFGKQGMLVTGTTVMAKSGVYPALMGDLKAQGMVVREIVREGREPTVREVDSIASAARAECVDWILGIGGGSALDLAKAAAGLARNEGSAGVYQEGKDLAKEGIPFVAVPTTAGTGSEITNNAVLINEQRRVKLSIRGDKMLARAAVLDPVLTRSMNPQVTSHTGLDALTQAIEAYVSKAANPLSDLLAEKAIEAIWGSLYGAFTNGNDLNAREQMLYGSLLSALAFSNAKLGAVHGFAHPIGALHDIPHGLVCGALLPHVMRFNLAGNIHEVTRKYGWIGRKMIGKGARESLSDADLASTAINSIIDLLESMRLPTRLAGLGLKPADIPAIVEQTKGSSLQNNPRETSKDSLEKLLRDSL